MLIVAHQDDETIGCAFLLQRHASLHISFCTDGGSPRSRPVWRGLGMARRSEYVATRRREAYAALRSSGATFRVEFHQKEDGELLKSLQPLYAELSTILQEFRPNFLVTHAYEGGHPDHDCCSFITRQLSEEFSVPVWEFPIYHRGRRGVVAQEFLRTSPDIERLFPDHERLLYKCNMMAIYQSQDRLGNLSIFDYSRPELYRPQPQYDFTQKPDPASSAYCVGGSDFESVLTAFSSFTRSCAVQSA
jgi:LmbE family N-acetylglucosaminyl deacetylase